MLRKFNRYLELKEVSVVSLKEPRKFSKQQVVVQAWECLLAVVALQVEAEECLLAVAVALLLLGCNLQCLSFLAQG
jgi:hypothetical protein